MLHEHVPDVVRRTYGRRGPFGAGRILLAPTGVHVAMMYTVYTGLKGREGIDISQTQIILSQDLLGIIYGGKIVETIRLDLTRMQVLERSATSLDEKMYPDKKMGSDEKTHTHTHSFMLHPSEMVFCCSLHFLCSNHFMRPYGQLCFKFIGLIELYQLNVQEVE